MNRLSNRITEVENLALYNKENHRKLLDDYYYLWNKYIQLQAWVSILSFFMLVILLAVGIDIFK